MLVKKMLVKKATGVQLHNVPWLDTTRDKLRDIALIFPNFAN